MISLGNRVVLVFICTIGAAAVPPNLGGQTIARSAQRPTFWGTIALGQAGISDSGMIHSSLGLSVQRRHLLLTGRVTGNQQGQKGDYRTRIKDAGILAGYATMPPAKLHFSIAGGVGIVSDIDDSSTVGFPVEAQASWRLLPWAGLGLRVFVVPNSLANYGGISLALDVGRLR
jgi:hypothetical protein